MRFFRVHSLRPFYKHRGSPATHAPLRVRQAFGRVPAPAPFRGRRCPACGFRLRPCLEPSLNRPGTFRFPGSSLRGGMRGRFPLPHPGAGGTVPAGPRLDALRAVPLSGYPARNAPVPLRSGRQTPACARFAALQPGAFGFAGPARRAPRRPGRRGRRTRAPSARGHAHRLPLVLGPRDRDRAFLRCWVCREAFLKATGEGLGRPLDSFALHPCGDTFRLDGAALAECTPLAGHVAAVVCETLFPSC